MLAGMLAGRPSAFSSVFIMRAAIPRSNKVRSPSIGSLGFIIRTGVQRERAIAGNAPPNSFRLRQSVRMLLRAGHVRR
jgi:hypothetical protein